MCLTNWQGLVGFFPLRPNFLLNQPINPAGSWWRWLISVNTWSLNRMPTYSRRPIFRYFLRKDERRPRMTRRKEKAMEPECAVCHTSSLFKNICLVADWLIGFVWMIDCCNPVLRIRIRDPVPFWPLDPGSGIGFFRIPDPKPIFLRA